MLNSGSSAFRERRAFTRVKMSVPIELKAKGMAGVIHTQTSDLSLGGCYVEMMMTLPMRTELEITLRPNGCKISLKGVVVTMDPQFGNGIRFVDSSREDRMCLREVLHAGLAGSASDESEVTQESDAVLIQRM